MTATVDVGARLRKLRASLGLSLRELEDRTGISAGNLSRVENGKRGLEWETVQQLAEALNVSPEYLWTGKEHAAVKALDELERIMDDAGAVIVRAVRRKHHA